MKKLLLTLLCLPMIGFGQEKSVWINAGIVISNNVEGSDFDVFSDEAKFISPLLSLNLLLPINENFNLDLILSYNQNKIKSPYLFISDAWGNIFGGIPIENTLNYLSINPSLDLKLFNNLLINKTSFSIGPFLGIVINNDRKFINIGGETQNFIPPTNEDLDFVEEVKKVDFGIKLGLSYSLTNRLKIVTEYKLGLTDLNNNSSSSNGIMLFDNSSVKSGTINCSLAYRL